MAGYYTDIVTLVVPSSAGAGETVPVTITIRNTYSAAVHVAAIGVWDSEKRFIDWLKYRIPAGQTHSFSGSFIMPSRDITVHAYSYYEDFEGYWRSDDEAEKKVSLKAVWQRLDTKIITISPAVPVGWVLLDTKPVTISPALAWVLLNKKIVTIEPLPTKWVLLASKTMTIEAIAAWLKLTGKTVTIQPAEVPGKDIFRNLIVEFKKH